MLIKGAKVYTAAHTFETKDVAVADSLRRAEMSGWSMQTAST